MYDEKREEIIHLVTVPKSLVLLKGQINFLRNQGYKISLLSSPGQELDNFKETSSKYSINMEREISLRSDFSSLNKIIRLFKNKNPLIVNSSTPKAGLLGIIGSFLTHVPIRIYTMRGLKLQTSKGLKFYLLWCMEKLCCSLSTDVICISNSIREEAINLKLVKPHKITLLGKGSSNGIKLDSFPENFNKKSIPIEEFNYEKFTIGYIGRIVKDKGIDEVIKIYKNLQYEGYDFQLLLIGSIEKGDPISERTYRTIFEDEGIIYLPHVDEPSLYYYLIDVFLFLTAREGFGNVSIEAQAAKTPVITYDVTGAKDTVINNKTGYIVKQGNVNIVKDKILLLYKNEKLRKEVGEAGRSFVFNNFDNVIVWNELDAFYKKKIKEVK